MTIMVGEVMSGENQLAVPMVGHAIVAASLVGHIIVGTEWHPAQQETVERLVLVLDDGRRIEIEPWAIGGLLGLSFGPEVTDSRQ